MSTTSVQSRTSSAAAAAATASSASSSRAVTTSVSSASSARTTTTSISVAPTTTSSLVTSSVVQSSSVARAASSSASASSSVGLAGVGVNTGSTAAAAESKKGLSSGAIGGIVGGIGGAILALGLLWFITRKSRQRRQREKYPLPPPRAMSFAPGASPVPVTLTAARRASSYGNLMSPSTPGTASSSYYGQSRQPSTSGYSSRGGHQRTSSYGQPLDPNGVSPARRLSFETDELPRHNGVGGGVHASEPVMTPSSSDSGGSPQIFPVEDPVNQSMGVKEPPSPGTSASPPPPTSSRSNSTRSSSGNEATTLGSSSLQHEFPSSRPRSTADSIHIQPSGLSPRNSRYSTVSMASTASRSRSFGPTSSLAPSSALRSGVPHGSRRIDLRMPAPLGPPVLPSVVDSNSWANGLGDQDRTWEGDSRERRRSRSEHFAHERMGSSAPLPEHQEGDADGFEEDEDVQGSDVAGTSEEQEEQGRQRRP